MMCLLTIKKRVHDYLCMSIRRTMASVNVKNPVCLSRNTFETQQESQICYKNNTVVIWPT
jgi:hypothetical protein